jgi:hypothetical protein
MAELGAALADPEAYLASQQSMVKRTTSVTLRVATAHVAPHRRPGRGLAFAALAAASLVLLSSSSTYNPPMARIAAAVHALSGPTLASASPTSP